MGKSTRLGSWEIYDLLYTLILNFPSSKSASSLLHSYQMLIAFGRDGLSTEGSQACRCLPGTERSQEKKESTLGWANLELIFFPFQKGKKPKSSSAALLSTAMLPDDLKDPRKLKVVSADKTIGFSDIVQKNYSMPCFSYLHPRITYLSLM